MVTLLCHCQQLFQALHGYPPRTFSRANSIKLLPPRSIHHLISSSASLLSASLIQIVRAHPQQHTSPHLHHCRLHSFIQAASSSSPAAYIISSSHLHHCRELIIRDALPDPLPHPPSPLQIAPAASDPPPHGASAQHTPPQPPMLRRPPHPLGCWRRQQRRQGLPLQAEGVGLGGGWCDGSERREALHTCHPGI